MKIHGLRVLKSFVLACLLGFFTGVSTAPAQQQQPTQDLDIVRLHLRGIRALGESGSQETFIAEGLGDIANKLRSLPFSRFSLLSNDEVAMPVHRKRSFPVAVNQSVTVRPLEIVGDVVSLWVSWRDGRGNKVIDTRIAIRRGDEMIAGTEMDNSEEGTVLVISAR